MQKRATQYLAVFASALLLTLVVLSCGKKASPIPPLVIVPKSPSQNNVTQAGDTMIYSFLLPTINTDNKTPAEISKIEIYRLLDPRIVLTQTQSQTQTAPQTQTQSQSQTQTQSQSQTQAQSQAQSQSQPQSQTQGQTQPQSQSQPQSQTQAQSQPQTAPAPEENPRKLEDAEFKSRSEKMIEIPGDLVDAYIHDGTFMYTDTINLAADSTDYQNWFYYGAKIYSKKGKAVGYSEIVAQFPAVVAKPPANFTATYDEEGVHLTWTASDKDIAGNAITVPVNYNIYRGKTADFPPVHPINQSGLTTTTYTDTSYEKGQAYYYFIRANISGQRAGQQSAPSNILLMFPQDTFAPSPPQELNAVAAREGMVLIWAPNPESDVAGYNIYRSETTGTGYTKINQDVVRETTYTDTSATVHQTYYYVVTAVDNAPVPNESKYSEEVEEVLRK